MGAVPLLRRATPMKVSYIRWRDACQVEASGTGVVPAKPELSELTTVGFLLAEDDDAVLLGMELQNDNTHPGRWRFNIPKSSIVERRDADIDDAFPPTPSRRSCPPRARRKKAA
jgi:hypothetical protein